MLLPLLIILLPGLAVADAPEPSDDEPVSKKEIFLREKAARSPAPAHSKDFPAVAPINLRNVWTQEVLPVDPTRPPPPDVVNRFFRCHYTDQTTTVDGRLLPTILRVAGKARATLVEIVSAYRSPKYNLMLRKKGHEVARESEHPLGHAVDFRIPGLSTKKLMRFVRSLRLGGVGYYPESEFVHCDVGRIRFWRGH